MINRPLVWVGASLSDVKQFPEDARRAIGYQLRRVQRGLMPTDWKTMKSVGAGVYEIRIRGRLEHRVLYLAKHSESIYVLHAFEKKSQKTPRADLETGRRRLKELETLRNNDRRLE